MKSAWILIAFLSGVILPLQAGLNARMSKAIASPVHAALISFVVGAVAISLFILITRQPVSWAGVKTAPPVVWIAGLLGAFYVTAVVLAFPRIGASLTFGLIVGGQLLMALLLDHFKVLVAQTHPITIWRVIGAILIVIGVVLIRKF